MAEASCYVHHPIDDLEPVLLTAGELREAHLRFLEILCDWARLITAVFAEQNPTIERLVPACYGPMFALGLPSLSGIAMADLERRFNVSRATISKTCIAFSERHGLPPSRYQKSIESRNSYSRSRLESVRRSNGNGEANGELNGELPPVAPKGRSV